MVRYLGVAYTSPNFSNPQHSYRRSNVTHKSRISFTEMKYSLPLEQTITFNLIDLFKFNVIVCFYYFIFNLFKPVIQVLITILYIIVVKVINFSQCSLGCLIALLKGVYKCFLLNLRNNITILITHQNIFVNPLISRNFNLGIPPTFL